MNRLRITGAAIGHGAERLKHELAGTRLGGSAPVRLVVRVIQELNDDDATHMAASVSYYAVLSLFPLVLGLSAIVGMVAQSPERQEDVIEFIVDYLPGSEAFVRDSLDGVVRFRATLGVASLLSLLWTGSAVFGAITRAVNRAWDVQKIPPFYKNKPRQLLMAGGITILFAISLSITSVFQWATSIELAGTNLEDLVGGAVVAGILKIPAFLISLGIFAFVYKVLPNTKTYWRYIWPGAIVAAITLRGRQEPVPLVPRELRRIRPAVRQRHFRDNPDGMGLFIRVYPDLGRGNILRVRPNKTGNTKRSDHSLTPTGTWCRNVTLWRVSNPFSTRL